MKLNIRKVLETKRKSGMINDLLNAFDSQLQEVILAISQSFDSKMKIGYRKSEFNSALRHIYNKIKAINEVAEFYCVLLKGKSISSIDLFEELQSLPFENPSKVEAELKKTYMEWYKIAIPNFPNFNVNKLIESYDFPNEHQEMIDKIKSSIDRLGEDLRFDYKTYFDDKSGLLVFTDSQEKALQEKYAVYASHEQVSEILSLHLLCVGLNSLRKDPYTFKSKLPEIDYRIMGKLLIAHDIAVDTAKIEATIGLPNLLTIR